MRFQDLLGLATEAQRPHRLRAVLTLGGIAIGVTAVVILTSLGEAAQRYVVDRFASLGSNLVVILPGKVETTGAPTFGGATRDLTIDDAVAIQRQAPAIRQAAPVSMGSARFAYEGVHRDVRVVGTTAAFKDIRAMTMRVGSFLPPGDPRHGDPVVVIGPKIHSELFQGQNPVGKPVRIGQWRFRVIGVVEAKGTFLGIDFDDMAFVPVSSGLRLFDQSSLFRIFTQCSSAEDVPTAIDQITRVLIDRHDGYEDFTLVTQDAMLATFQSVIDALTSALAGIAAVSLAVAGIGIMNVMLISVSERAPEVGLFKALGAGRRQILSVFLVEALLLSSVGAALGITVGSMLVFVAAAVFPDFPLQPSARWIVGVMALALTAGVAFGLMPARRAARLQAADALRRGH